MNRVAIAMLASMFLLLAPASTAVEESAVFTVGDKWAFGKEIDLMEEASSVISELENNITEFMSSEEAEMLKNITGFELTSFKLDNEAIIGFYYTGEVIDDFDQMIHMQTEQSLYSHTVLGTQFTGMFLGEGTHELRLECTGSEEDPDCKLLDNTTGEQLDLEELTTEIGGSMHYVAKVTQDTWWTQDTHELAKTEITFALGVAGDITIKNVPNIGLAKSVFRSKIRKVKSLPSTSLLKLVCMPPVVTKGIVFLAIFFIGKYFVCFADLFEMFFRIFVSRINIRVVFSS